jgi:hypothetical protein
MWQNVFVMRRTKLYSAVRISSMLSWFRWYNWLGTIYVLSLFLFINILINDCIVELFKFYNGWDSRLKQESTENPMEMRKFIYVLSMFLFIHILINDCIVEMFKFYNGWDSRLKQESTENPMESRIQSS